MIKVLIILITLFLIVSCCDENTTEPNYNSSFEIQSSHYANNCFYFDQPEIMYETYSEDEVNDLDLPSGWANNAIKLDEDCQWKLNYEYYPSLPDFSTLRVFIDDGISYNNYSAIEGHEIGVPDSIYHFNEYTIGIDFNIKNFTLIFRDDLFLYNKAIGVTYIQNNGSQVGVPNSSSIEVKILKKPNQTFIDDPEYWNLQARNSYKYENIYLNNYSYPIIGYRNEYDDPLVISIPDSIDTGSYNSIDNFVEYLRLDSNNDGKINTEDTTFGTEYFLILFPFIHPFKSLEGIELYQDHYEEGDYYIRIEDTYHY